MFGLRQNLRVRQALGVRIEVEVDALQGTWQSQPTNQQHQQHDLKLHSHSSLNRSAPKLSHMRKRASRCSLRLIQSGLNALPDAEIADDPHCNQTEEDLPVDLTQFFNSTRDGQYSAPGQQPLDLLTDQTAEGSGVVAGSPGQLGAEGEHQVEQCPGQEDDVTHAAVHQNQLTSIANTWPGNTDRIHGATL
ncbi:hypothetical protein AOLI_G00092160 [Acnodon oligacanthus]